MSKLFEAVNDLKHYTLKEGYEERKSILDRIANKLVNSIKEEFKKQAPDFMKNYTISTDDFSDTDNFVELAIRFTNGEGEQLETFIGLSNPTEELANEISSHYMSYDDAEVLYAEIFVQGEPQERTEIPIVDLKDVSKVPSYASRIVKDYLEAVAANESCGKNESCNKLTEADGDCVFTLKINCSNEEFEGEPEIVVAKMLKDLAQNLEYTDNKSILDSNGNTVGSYSFGYEGVAGADSVE